MRISSKAEMHGEIKYDGIKWLFKVGAFSTLSRAKACSLARLKDGTAKRDLHSRLFSKESIL